MQIAKFSKLTGMLALLGVLCSHAAAAPALWYQTQTAAGCAALASLIPAASTCRPYLLVGTEVVHSTIRAVSFTVVYRLNGTERTLSTVVNVEMGRAVALFPIGADFELVSARGEFLFSNGDGAVLRLQ
jgi:hypothetical protein